jgi:predicted nucleotidyltransferase
MARQVAEVRRKIAEMVRRIVKRFRPERIILFGSHARGTAGPDSDVDLVVVLRSVEDEWAKSVEVRGVVRGLKIPVDILVKTPEDLQRRGRIAGTIEYPIMHEGRVLYARE